MGVLNVTPDSFSDGGLFEDPGAAIERGLELREQGADILDIGGESTRPGARPVSAAEEMDRVLPVIEGLSGTDTILSIDTSKPEVADAAFRAGAHVVNDVTGLSPEMLEVAAAHDAAGIAMHMQGEPRTMQRRPRYDDVVAEVGAYLQARVEAAAQMGVPCIVDPGIGFGKTLQHNLSLLSSLDELARLGAPLLVGVSRKSFLGRITGGAAPDRLEGTLAAHLHAVRLGADIVRAHDVAAHARALAVDLAIRHAGSGVDGRGRGHADVLVEGLECSCSIGVTAAERATRQTVVLEISLQVEPRRAGAIDELDTTIDYATVARQARSIAEGASWQLVETLVDTLCRDLLSRHPGLGVTVEARKPAAASSLGCTAVGYRQSILRGSDRR